VLVSQVVDRRFACVDSSWRTYISGGVYIPAVAQQQLATLKRGSPKSLSTELERLAALGSPWGSALLAYQALLLRADGTRETDRAIALCKEPAARDDAYAQYILGWATLLKGDRAGAGVYFKAACRQLFPPAVLDSVGFFWNSPERTSPAGVLMSLKRAGTVGHYATPYWRCRIYLTGKLGIARLIWGCICMPVVVLSYMLACWRHPFSARIFVFDVAARSRSLVKRND
jgi:hypothetical protein